MSPRGRRDHTPSMTLNPSDKPRQARQSGLRADAHPPLPSLGAQQLLSSCSAAWCRRSRSWRRRSARSGSVNRRDDFLAMTAPFDGGPPAAGLCRPNRSPKGCENQTVQVCRGRVAPDHGLPDIARPPPLPLLDRSDSRLVGRPGCRFRSRSVDRLGSGSPTLPLRPPDEQMQQRGARHWTTASSPGSVSPDSMRAHASSPRPCKSDTRCTGLDTDLPRPHGVSLG
jgi:hypothetical protein